MATVENTSNNAVAYLICTSIGFAFLSWQSQLITILLYAEHRVTEHMSELFKASLTLHGRLCIIIDINSPSPNLGVACLYLPFGTVVDKDVVEG